MLAKIIFGAAVRLNTNLADVEVDLAESGLPFPPECRTILLSATASMNLTARSYFKVLKISRTISDLSGEKNIQPTHIAEALQKRPKDSEF